MIITKIPIIEIIEIRYLFGLCLKITNSKMKRTNNIVINETINHVSIGIRPL